jgi:hypothetical protein
MFNFYQLIRKLAVSLCITAALSLAGCVSGPPQAAHAFEFDGWNDKWNATIDLLEYGYGDQYQMVRRKATTDQPLKPAAGVNGLMPIGEFLYVKWRIKVTGEVIEDKVDLRSKLAKNMFEHRVTFVIDQKQLYVYLVTPVWKKVGTPPILKSHWSETYVTFEIYPTNTYKPQ